MTQDELLQQQVPEILKRFFGNQVIIHSNKVLKKKLHTVVHSLLVKMVTYSQTIM